MMEVTIPYLGTFDLVEVIAPLAVARPYLAFLVWLSLLVGIIGIVNRLVGYGAGLRAASDSDDDYFVYELNSRGRV